MKRHLLSFSALLVLGAAASLAVSMQDQHGVASVDAPAPAEPGMVAVDPTTGVRVSLRTAQSDRTLAQVTAAAQLMYVSSQVAKDSLDGVEASRLDTKDAFGSEHRVWVAVRKGYIVYLDVACKKPGKLQLTAQGVRGSFHWNS